MHTAAGLRRLTALSMILLLAFAGCSSEPGPRGRRGGPAGPRGRAPTPMAGQDNFFDGQILVEITVGTDGMPEPGASAGGGERGESGRGRRGGGGGNLSVAGGGGLVGGNVSGGVPFGRGGGRPGRNGAGPGGEPVGPRPLMAGAIGRPVMIHLRFTNQGQAAVTLWIDDFVSPLGNFAVRPEKLVLEPGQALETEPMSSQLAGAFAETDVTLALRLGPQAEKKTFRLKAAVVPKEAEPKPKE